ncbi:thioesterase family protein [Caulobacter sp. NIBR2454]|uniref:thioesterase family protein n=1 Tax=Caulobacter sp. NIBR2454 TaxID=3015996 RepID=UPI0022B607DB|nr:thioesterase family protein [Caulobacter sp. NIBR2454]
MSEQTGVEVWRGGVNTWECDEMGHMNVRFYVAKAMECVAGLAAELGMPGAFTPHTNATLVVRDIHVRFLREAHAGAMLSAEAGVLDIAEDSLCALLIMRHADGQPAATCQVNLSHATARDGLPFPWPAKVLEQAQRLRVNLPDIAKARSVDLSPFESAASLEAAHRLGLLRIGLGVISPQDCDVFGRMRPDVYIGRISDGVNGLVEPLRDIVASHAEPRPTRVGGAALEFHLVFLDWPRAGARYELRSGVMTADAKTFHLIHWMVDPDTGRPWGTAKAVATAFDLDARKIVPIGPEASKALAARFTPGLSR